MYNTANTAASLGVTTASGLVGVVFCCFYIAAVAIGIAACVLWLWMLIDVITRKDDQFGESFGKDAKVLWILLVLFASWIGALAYYFMVYKKYPRK